MNKAFIILIIILEFSSHASLFSKSELDKVSLEIDNICADSWCDGEFNWNYYNLRCDLSLGKCRLNIVLIDEYYFSNRSDKENQDRYNYESFMFKKYNDLGMDNNNDKRKILMDKVCTINDMSTKEDVISYSRSQLIYSDKLYENVNRCISVMEEDFFKRQESL